MSTRGMKRVRPASKSDESIKDEPQKKAKKRLKACTVSSSLPLSVTVEPVISKPSVESSTIEISKTPSDVSLGSLPLFGEELPARGFNDIPSSTKLTCNQIREVFSKIKSLNEDKSSEAEVNAQKQRGLVLFSYLKKLNRLAHLYCKDSREQTHEQKLEVDDLHLQLQNLKYEAMHLRKEITNCLEFKSQHEDIELVSEEEMYTNAPETISKPEVSHDEHQRMLSRLQWEMEERKSLADQRSGLEGEIQQLDTEISLMEARLSGLLPSLEELRKATLPLQESLGVELDKDREERELALLLPRGLYVLFTQAKAYAQVQDSSLTASIEGDLREAKAFLTNKDKEQSDDDSGDSDGENKEEGARRKKRRKRAKGNREKRDLSKAYPLAVVLTFEMRDIGSFQITVNYLPHFAAVCASITNLTLHNITESHLKTLREGSTLLHCLTEGDTGRTSPNSIVSLNIRKHSGDIFSTAVRQHGFPYKWIQKVCGFNDQSDLSVPSMPSGEGGVAGGEPQEFQWLNDPQMELSAVHLEGIIKALKKRFRAQINLVTQIIALGSDDHRIEVGPDGECLFRGTPASQLTKWEALSHSEVKTFLPTIPSLVVLNTQERTNRFFLFTLQLNKANLRGIVSMGVAYPTTPPCFAIVIEDNGNKESGTIQTKNIEAEVSLNFPSSLQGDKYGKYLLCRQIRRLQECFELYVMHRQSSGRVAKTLCTVRGKGRLLKLSDM